MTPLPDWALTEARDIVRIVREYKIVDPVEAVAVRLLLIQADQRMHETLENLRRFRERKVKEDAS